MVRAQWGPMTKANRRAALTGFAAGLLTMTALAGASFA